MLVYDRRLAIVRQLSTMLLLVWQRQDRDILQGRTKVFLHLVFELTSPYV
jgi:hypothetical protein